MRVVLPSWDAMVELTGLKVLVPQEAQQGIQMTQTLPLCFLHCTCVLHSRPPTPFPPQPPKERDLT